MGELLEQQARQQLDRLAHRLEPELIAFRRMLHRYPELAFQEAVTSAKVAEALESIPVQVTKGMGGTGLAAEIEGHLPGPVIVLRADMDALPIQEETGLPYMSERPGLMHACGHDAHTAILVGAARLLAGMREHLAGKVRLLFQPAEEINAGASAMIKDGALEGAAEIYALHNHPGLPAGRVAISNGPMMGSVDRFEITVEGVGGHGAIPDRSIDPIVAGSALVMALQTLASRELSPFDPAVITVGSFRAGDANNVIPDRAELTGTVRTFHSAVQAGMRGRMERVVRCTAEAFRCRAELRYTEQTPVLAGHEPCVAHVRAAAREVLGKDMVMEAEPTMAGEDFSLFLRHLPGALFWLGAGPEQGTEGAYGLHHPRYAPEEDCLVPGAKLMTVIALTRGKALMNRL